MISHGEQQCGGVIKVGPTIAAAIIILNATVLRHEGLADLPRPANLKQRDHVIVAVLDWRA